MNKRENIFFVTLIVMIVCLTIYYFITDIILPTSQQQIEQNEEIEEFIEPSMVKYDDFIFNLNEGFINYEYSLSQNIKDITQSKLFKLQNGVYLGVLLNDEVEVTSIVLTVYGDREYCEVTFEEVAILTITEFEQAKAYAFGREIYMNLLGQFDIDYGESNVSEYQNDLFRYSLKRMSSSDGNKLEYSLYCTNLMADADNDYLPEILKSIEENLSWDKFFMGK